MVQAAGTSSVLNDLCLRANPHRNRFLKQDLKSKFRVNYFQRQIRLLNIRQTQLAEHVQIRLEQEAELGEFDVLTATTSPRHWSAIPAEPAGLRPQYLAKGVEREHDAGRESAPKWTAQIKPGP